MSADFKLYNKAYAMQPSMALSAAYNNLLSLAKMYH